ncbi:TrbC/VirB2 family protein [Burkholderia cepacia]|uniref:TrbC/VirB2 family protein n=1 Tax=Burkholderia cepacia TaxID=292 RepID=UPI000AA6CD65|nr:TrbC/VirB2 family protein [Burkholderia cepacia]
MSAISMVDRGEGSIAVLAAAATDRNKELRQWAVAILLTLGLLALLFYASGAYASEGQEFTEATAKWEQWVKGNLGKLAAFIAIGVGSIVAAVKKDWSWFFGAVVLAMGVGVIVGIVNASFTATV